MRVYCIDGLSTYTACILYEHIYDKCTVFEICTNISNYCTHTFIFKVKVMRILPFMEVGHLPYQWERHDGNLFALRKSMPISFALENVYIYIYIDCVRIVYMLYLYNMSKARADHLPSK